MPRQRAAAGLVELLIRKARWNGRTTRKGRSRSASAKSANAADKAAIIVLLDRR